MLGALIDGCVIPDRMDYKMHKGTIKYVLQGSFLNMGHRWSLFYFILAI